MIASHAEHITPTRSSGEQAVPRDGDRRSEKKAPPPGPGLVFQSRFNQSRFGDDRGRGIEIKVIVQSDADNVSMELAADQAHAVQGGARV